MVLHLNPRNDASSLFCLELVVGWCKSYIKLQENTVATKRYYNCGRDTFLEGDVATDRVSGGDWVTGKLLYYP